MKTSELRQKNKQELAVMLDEKLAKLAELRFDLSAGKVKNLKEVRQIKLDVARIKTLQKETIEN
ncbi:MAG: 50S ribosomal protein L29 [Minisyncoccales bacterium]|jgi:ribosomal protein L29